MDGNIINHVGENLNDCRHQRPAYVFQHDAAFLVFLQLHPRSIFVFMDDMSKTISVLTNPYGPTKGVEAPNNNMYFNSFWNLLQHIKPKVNCTARMRTTEKQLLHCSSLEVNHTTFRTIPVPTSQIILCPHHLIFFSTT